MIPIIFAHRGANRVAPENTLAAFQTAYALGARAIELDVQLSADLLPVVIHDDTLERTSNGHGLVSGYAYQQLRALDAGSWFAPEFSNQTILTLAEVLLDLIPSGLYLNLELKPNALDKRLLVDTVLHILNEMKVKPEQILLSSFDPQVIELLAKHRIHQNYALLVETYAEHLFLFARNQGCASINPSLSVLKRQGSNFIKQAHQHGLKVFCFTINDASEADRWLALGLDGFFTDNEALFTHRSSNAS